mgnify:CR=1 FL=1
MSNLDGLVVTLIREGHWREAVGLCRDELGVSLIQAEHKVQTIAEETGLQDSNPWSFWLTASFAAVATIAFAYCIQWFWM